MSKIGLIGLVGEAAKSDFWGTYNKVAEIGYKGVESPGYLLQGNVKENLERFRRLGLDVINIGTSREELNSDIDKVIANAKALEVPRVTLWWAPCSSRDELLRDAEVYNTAGAKLAAEGLTLCYHNHDHEFKASFNGVYALDILAENTDPKSLSFELDIAWITYGGEDPSKVLTRYRGRVPAIHVKDFATIHEPNQFTSVGTGVVNIKEAVAKAEEIGVEWLVVEQDRLRNLTEFETITLSYLYMKEAGLI